MTEYSGPKHGFAVYSFHEERHLRAHREIGMRGCYLAIGQNGGCDGHVRLHLEEREAEGLSVLGIDLFGISLLLDVFKRESLLLDVFKREILFSHFNAVTRIDVWRYSAAEDWILDGQLF